MLIDSSHQDYTKTACGNCIAFLYPILYHDLKNEPSGFECISLEHAARESKNG